MESLDCLYCSIIVAYYDEDFEDRPPVVWCKECYLNERHKE